MQQGTYSGAALETLLNKEVYDDSITQDANRRTIHCEHPNRRGIRPGTLG